MSTSQAKIQFDVAKPYLQQTVDLDPKSTEALSHLRRYCRIKIDKANEAENKAKADQLKKQIDALK